MKYTTLDAVLEDLESTQRRVTLNETALVDWLTAYPVVEETDCDIVTKDGATLYVARPNAEIVAVVDSYDGDDGWHPIDIQGGKADGAAIFHNLTEGGESAPHLDGCRVCDWRG